MNLIKLTRAIRNLEITIINIISSFAPWLAPIAPAYMSYHNALDKLNFPPWVALVVGLVVEFLGLTTISTALSFWYHNKKYKSDKNRVPIEIPIFAFIFYLIVVVTLNVMLEAIPNNPFIIIAARALLVFLSVPAAVILAVRAVHVQVLDSLIRRPANPATQIDRVKRKPAKSAIHKCEGCEKRFAKVQGLSAHYKHNPNHYKSRKIPKNDKSENKPPDHASDLRGIRTVKPDKTHQPPFTKREGG